MFKTEETRLLPLLWWLKPYFLLAVFSLNGGSLKTAEQQPVGKIPQVRLGQVTRLFLEEVTDSIHRYIWRRAIHCPAATQICNLQIWALMLMVNVFVYLSYKAQFLLWGQYWQVCLLVRMSGSRDNRLFSPRLSTQLWMWWIKVFLSFSNSDRRIYTVMEAPCDKLWSVFECACTSAVHVAGHHRVEIPSLEVQQKASFRHVSFQAHQSVKNDLKWP